MLSKAYSDDQPAPERARAYTGILPCQAISEMIEVGDIKAPNIEPGQIQPASLDLRLGPYAFPVDTSFLPGATLGVFEKMAQLDSRHKDFKIDLRDSAVLEKGRIYLIPLLEEINLKSDVAGFANPKSSTGRLDILTRLITDRGTAFDQIEKGYAGKLYLEVVPRTFSIVVKTGARLNQLRFSRMRGAAAAAIPQLEWERLLGEGQIVRLADDEKKLSEEKGMLRFSVDLRGDGTDGALIGYRAKRHAPRIDLDKRDYDPLDFWEPLRVHKNAALVLDPNEFYILMTREAVAVPPDYAAEMVPYDTRAGEFRVHYAGFFDPGFGWDRATGKAGGSRAVLEVRSHEVPFLLEHGQTVGWLRYERMAARPEKLYGQSGDSNYQNQGLKLAKQFRAIKN
jgi:dCTP deaminase